MIAWRILTALIALGLLTPAVLMSTHPAQLTYPQVIDGETTTTTTTTTVVIECSSNGDGADHRRLRQDQGEAFHYRVLAGEEALDEQRNEVEEPFAVSRGIDSDCLRAADSRLLSIVWWLAAAMLALFVFTNAMARTSPPER